MFVVFGTWIKSRLQFLPGVGEPTDGSVPVTLLASEQAAMFLTHTVEVEIVYWNELYMCLLSEHSPFSKTMENGMNLV